MSLKELEESIHKNVPLTSTKKIDANTENIVELIQEVVWNIIPEIKGTGRRNNVPLEIIIFFVGKEKPEESVTIRELKKNKTIVSEFTQLISREIKK